MNTQITTDRLAQWQADESRLRSLPRPVAGVAEAQAIVGMTGLQMMQANLVGPDGTRYAHGTTTCLAFDMRTPG